MAGDIGDRLERAIQEEDEKTEARIRKMRASSRASEQEFAPVRQAADEIRDRLKSVPSIKFAINPDSVWITLSDREVWLGYDSETREFVGEEIAHSWYDGEPYTDRFTWDSAEQCIDALIRFCARYARMARAISGYATES